MTRGTDGGNANGIAAENAVNTAEFYFYNEDGTYNQHVGKTLTWNNATGNVEKIADATVVLQNLKKVGKPRYVVCVLNATPKAYENKTLAQLKEQIAKDYVTNSKFIMTNSTYNNGDAASLYFATKIEDNNFLKEKPTPETLTTTNAVQVYVERLASKIKLDTELNLTGDAQNEITIGTYDVNGEDQEIKIKILGWGINALNKTSYVEKRVPAWETALGFAWDDKTNFRSYWACSPNYGGGAYPASFADVVKNNNSTDKVTVTNDAAYSLKYVSWTSLGNALGGIDYCLENTNTQTILQAKDENIKAKVTHVLLKAQTVGNEDLIRYEGRLYTKQNFLNLILAQLNMPLYTKNGDTYTQIATSDLAVVNTYDGTVDMALTTEAAAKTWYKKDGGSYTACDVATINTKFDDLEIKADYYKSGMMYYCIPVEHLRGGKFSVDDSGIHVNEADYGVVRNHYYKINITSIKNLGTAVYNPDEEIVPNMEPQTYYVGAQVNILSWKVVNQSVEL